LFLSIDLPSLETLDSTETICVENCLVAPICEVSVDSIDCCAAIAAELLDTSAELKFVI
jgi:hypothetical protein